MNKLKRVNKRIFYHKVTSESLRLGVVLAAVGGFLDAYTYLEYGGAFANAQTGNIVLLGVHIAQLEYTKALNSLLPIIACGLGVVCAEMIKNRINESMNVKWEKGIILLEMLLMIFLAVTKGYINDIITIILISFVSSVQIQSFRKLVDSPYCTTMCTGNLRTTCESIYLGIIKKDTDKIKKSLRLSVIILFFIVGGFIGSVFCSVLHKNAIWIVAMLLLLALTIFRLDEIRDEKE